VLAVKAEQVATFLGKKITPQLRLLGLIKRVAGTYRYYLTRLGRAAIARRMGYCVLPTRPGTP
jgi:hypothetical protein